LKRGLILALILFIFGGLLIKCSPAEAQSLPFPSIPLMVEGVKGCEVEFNKVTYYPESNYMILSGNVGDRIKVTKGVVIRYYNYINPMGTPVLHIDMDKPINVMYKGIPFIQRVWFQLTRQGLCEIF